MCKKYYKRNNDIYLDYVKYNRHYMKNKLQKHKDFMKYLYLLDLMLQSDYRSRYF